MARKPRSKKPPLRGQVKNARRLQALGTHSERLRVLFANRKQTDTALDVLGQYARELDPDRPGADAAPAPVLKALSELPQARRDELLSLLRERDPSAPVDNLIQSEAGDFMLPEAEAEELAQDKPKKKSALSTRSDNERYATKFGLSEDPGSLTDQQLVDMVAEHRDALYESGRLGILAGDTSTGEKGRVERYSPLEKAERALDKGNINDAQRERLVNDIIGEGAAGELNRKLDKAADATGAERRPYGEGGAEDQLDIPRVKPARPGRRSLLSRSPDHIGAHPFSGSSALPTYRRLLEVREHLAKTGELLDYRVPGPNFELAEPMLLSNEGKARALNFLNQEIARIEEFRNRAGVSPDSDKGVPTTETPAYQDPDLTLMTGTGGSNPNASGRYNKSKSLDFQAAESGTTPTRRLADDLLRLSRENSGVPVEDTGMGQGSVTRDLLDENTSHLQTVNLDGQMPTWRQQAALIDERGNISFPQQAPTPEALGRRIARIIGLGKEETEMFVSEVRDVLGKSIRAQAPNAPAGAAAKRANIRMVPGEQGMKMFRTKGGQAVNRAMFDPETEMFQNPDATLSYTHDGGSEMPMGQGDIQDEIARLRGEIESADAVDAVEADSGPLDDLGDLPLDEMFKRLDAEMKGVDDDPSATPPPPEEGPLDDLAIRRINPLNRKALQGLLA